MTQGETKKQHVVAEFYLRGFADDKGKLATRMRNGFAGPATPHRATRRHEYYTFFTDDGTRDQAIEDWFSTGIEAPASRVLDRLRTGEQPEPDDTPILARFVTTSLLRTATVRAYLEQIDDHVGPMLVLSFVAKTHPELDLVNMPPNQVEHLLPIARRALADLPARSQDKVRSRLRTILRKSDEMAERLTSWNWRCEHATDLAFITADAPVATLDPLLDGGWHGVIPPGSPVFMPISPTHLLVGDPNPPLGTPRPASPALIDMVNITLARGAYEAIFANPQMNWPPELRLSPRKPALPTPRTTITASQPDQSPTFPTEFDPVIDPVVQQLLNALGANDSVQ